MTALPIIETQAGDVSAIFRLTSFPSPMANLQQARPFYAGVRPAVNVGLSVLGWVARPGEGHESSRPCVLT